MSIETVGSMNNILSNFNAKDWTKSAELNTAKSLDFGKLTAPGVKAHETKQSFAEVLASSVSEVNNLQKDANMAVQKLVTGENKNIHETMLAVEKADIAFKTMNQVRMKVINAYQEIMKMQV